MSLMMNLSDDNLSLLSIFLNLHILNLAKILYSEWPKYSKCSLNDTKTTNLLHFVLFHNYEFNLSLISVFQNFTDQPVYVIIGETGASCYPGMLLQSKYLARWCIDGVAIV